MVALLALRVSIGWHFYKEGAKKLQSPNGFTSAPFLRNAKGPWAESFHDMARQPHDWDRLLAIPLENIDLTDEQKEEIAIWQKEHKEELASDNPPLLPHTSYLSYAERISEDWKQDLEGMIRRAKLPKIDREGIKEEYSKSVEKIVEDLKKDLETLKKKEELAVADFEKLQSKTAAALKDVSKELSKDLEKVIEKLKLSEETAETEIADLEEKSVELSAAWEKGLSKFISNSYSEVAEEKPAAEADKEDKPAEEAEKAEQPEEASAEPAKAKTPEVGEPPEPVEEPAESTKDEAQESPAEASQAEEAKAEEAKAEESETAETQPAQPQLEITVPEKEEFDGLMLNWQDDVADYVDSTDPAKLAADKYAEYRRYLFAYLADIEEDLRKYQHEVWRLHQMENSATASDLPYQQGRIAEKSKETAGMVAPWISDIDSLELAYHESVGKILGSPDEPVTVAPRTDKLSTIDSIVPYWHLIVGGGLILGLFSRLCGTAAAIFLAAVIATQPPWVAGAADTYYQVVELCGCLVLATIPTGRFAGLDFFVHSFFSRCCTKS